MIKQPYIKNLILEGPEFADFEMSGTEAKTLNGLSRINLFVGANNSGKSRFIRALSRIQAPTFVPHLDLAPLRTSRAHLKAQVDRMVSGMIQEVGGFKAATESLPKFETITAGEEHFKAILNLAETLARTVPNGLQITTRGGVDHGQIAMICRRIGDDTKRELKDAMDGLPQKLDFARVYIPALRGLRAFKNVGDVYRDRTVSDYFNDHKGAPEVFTGLELYSQIKSLLLGNLVDRGVIKEFQDFLSETFFEGVPVALIPRETSDVLFVKIGEEEEQPIFNLGDGVQMVIAITFPVFRSANRQLLLFIEEPEIYLHPGLQRILVNTLASFQNLQCFIATHSNHLLDLSLDRTDLAIFHVAKNLDGEGLEKKARAIVENLSGPEHRVLRALGVRNSSVFLTNCTIWVEGITDRRYIRRYLRLYMAHLEGKASTIEPSNDRYREDLHYSFVEYGGGNITHWSFLDTTDDPIEVNRLCARLFLVVDSDPDSGKAKRHEQLEKALGNRFYKLASREIENTLTPRIIASVISEYEGATTSMDGVVHSDYAKNPLGRFLDDLLKERKRKASYAADSGTVSDKIGFCEKAVEYLKDYNDLSSDAKELAKAIYEFIKDHNPSASVPAEKDLARERV